MRTCTIVVLAAGLALAACDKGGKGAANNDKTAPPADDPAKGNGARSTPPAPPTSTAPAAVGADAITLHYAVPAVGTRWIEERGQTMDLDITAEGQHAKMTADRREGKTIEILAVTADAISKAKVSYEVVQNSQKVAGKEHFGPSPLVGKTYTLTAGSPIVVSTDAGPAPEAEAAAVQEIEQSFGKPSRMGTLLANRSFPRDQATDLPAGEIGQALGDDPSMIVQKLTLTYRGMAGDLATFDIAMTVVQDRDGNHMAMELAGKLLIHPKANDVGSLALDGSVTLTGKAAAKGTMQMRQKRTAR